MGRNFIDSYLPTYISLSGSASARSSLFASILEMAQVHRETLNSQNWTDKVVQERLKNALRAHNKAEKQAAPAPAAAEAATEAAPAEAATAAEQAA